MTNPKENTDLREQIAGKLHELRKSVQRDPLSTTSTEWAIRDIEKLVHQARENAVEEYKESCKGKLLRRSPEIERTKPIRFKELESKEESI